MTNWKYQDYFGQRRYYLTNLASIGKIGNELSKEATIDRNLTA
jgi:excisionase family DNA binding protein